VIFLEVWSEIKTKNKVKCLTELELKYCFLKAKKKKTSLSEALAGYEVCNDDEIGIICIYRVRS